MRFLPRIATTALLLATLAILPSAFVSARMMVNQVSATIPHHGSPIEQAEFWFRAFGP
jgi:hypothetical protein